MLISRDFYRSVPVYTGRDSSAQYLWECGERLNSYWRQSWWCLEFSWMKLTVVTITRNTWLNLSPFYCIFPLLSQSQFYLFVKSSFLFSPLPCPQLCVQFRTWSIFSVNSGSVFLPFSLVYCLLIKFCRWQFEILVGRVMWLLMLCRSLLHNL